MRYHHPPRYFQHKPVERTMKKKKKVKGTDVTLTKTKNSLHFVELSRVSKTKVTNKQTKNHKMPIYFLTSKNILIPKVWKETQSYVYLLQLFGSLL